METAESVADYTSNFYAGSPAVTKNRFGQGVVYYIGTQLEKDFLDTILDEATNSANLTAVIEGETNLEISCRHTEEAVYYFIINFQKQAQKVPAQFVGKKDLLSGKHLTEDSVADQYSVYVIKEGRSE